MTTTAKRTLGMIAAVLVVVGALAALKYYSIHRVTVARAAAKLPPVTVAAINATETPWQRQLHAPGNLTAAQGVTVSNELSGSVAKIDFKVDLDQEQMVFCEATIAFPILAGCAYHRGSWRGRKGFNFNSQLAKTEEPAARK